MHPGEPLYRLQQIDLAILQRAKRLEAIRQALEDDETVRSAQEQRSAAENTLRPLQTRQRDLELQISAARSKQKATEDRLYSGVVKNPKELQDMEHEIAALTHRQAELEDLALLLMLELEEAQAQLDDAENNLQRVNAEAQIRHADLIQERERLQAESRDLREKRKGAQQNIAPDLLQRYETMRPQKANQPIALLTNDACSVCGITQTGIVAQQVRRGEGLVNCANCKRILVYLS